jgi:DNA-binding PadR family transcriptional regulator
MPIQHAVLALLGDGPSYGYELKANFEESIGPQWGELNIGHLYQILDRLVREGFVRKRVVQQANRPDKTVYRLTKQGEAELGRWLEAPFVRQAGYRDDFFLKLFAASRLGAKPLGRVIRIQREAYMTELASLRQLQKNHADDPLVGLLIEAAVLHTEANLRVVDLADENRRSFAQAARVTRTRTEELERADRAEACRS